MIPVLRKATLDHRLWLLSLLSWFGVLWILSSRSGDLQDLPKIPFFDKFAHFGYFLIGGALLSGFLFIRKNGAVRWLPIFAIVLVVMGGIGILDEYHQTFTPRPERKRSL